MRKKKLTEKQELTLNFIRNFWDKNKTMPTIQEIADGMGCSGAATFSKVKHLEEKGYLKRDRRPRMMKLI